MIEKGLIYAFINVEQACRFGHLGWGFLDETDTFVFGSTDHLYHHNVWDLPAWLKYMDVPVGENVDWWSARGSESEMLSSMRAGCSNSRRHLNYHYYKILRISDPRPAEARKVAEGQEFGGWSVLANNCVHHAHQIFAEYGAGQLIPDPRSAPTRVIPKTWYSLLNGPSLTL
jgi:hypothetical protein